jgi:hypothetical protein
MQREILKYPTVDPPWDIISRVTRGHHALKQYGVRELLLLIFKDFQDVYVTFNDPKDTCSNILKRKLRYT